jgi:hypothetical protein
MLMNLIKSFGVLYLPEEKINIILYIFPILNCLLRVFWDYICDKHGFKKVYFSILFLTVKKF